MYHQRSCESDQIYASVPCHQMSVTRLWTLYCKHILIYNCEQKLHSLIVFLYGTVTFLKLFGRECNLA